VPAAFTVTNTDDSGVGSLRQAILDANAAPGADTINFALPDSLKAPGNDWWTIQPLTSLPTLTDTVLVDGWSQPGAGSGLAPKVMLDGSIAASVTTGWVDGLTLGADGCVIRGLAIRSFVGNGGSGIHIAGADATIQGCYVGFDPSGDKTALGNYLGIYDKGLYAMIGGANPGEGNVISGNAWGISSDGAGTIIRGNRIGTNPAGTAPLPNVVAGIGIGGTSALTPATVGGSGLGEGNLISGNAEDGLSVGNYVRVMGNLIGTDITGMNSLGNAQDGILVSGASPTNTVIGGTDPGSRNVISGNGRDGIEVQLDSPGGTTVQGNYVGTDVNGAPTLGNGREGIAASSNCLIGGSVAGAGNLVAGNVFGIACYGSNNQIIGNVICDNGGAGVGSRGSNTQIIGNVIHDNGGAGVQVNGGSSQGLPDGVYPQGDTISANSIYANGGLGIDLQWTDPNTGQPVTGVTLNDSAGHDLSNHLQNFPILTAAHCAAATGTLNSTPNTTFRIEFFANHLPGHPNTNDPNDHNLYGEGERYIGFLEVTTDDAGNASFNAPIEALLPGEQYITATATNEATGDTSEFSNAVAVEPQTATVTTVTSSVNPSLLNQGVTFTATVTPASSGNMTPTGTVQFQIDGVNAGGLVSLGSGSASFSISTLSAGTHTIMAVYSGDCDFLSSSGSLTESVQYKFSGFLAPLNSNMAMALNRTVPIKFQLTDYNGKYITSLSAVQSLTVPGGTLSALRYDSTANQFIANWQTKGLPAGTYAITLALADGTTYTKLVTLSKNGTSAGLVTAGTTASTTAVGALLGGDITLYVDNTNGDLTSDELARIQDAVMAADAVTEPYGVAVTEVTDPTLADVTLNMDTTSAVGGYAAGVLGCTTDAGQITIITGWNFYAGSDATQIGSAQYDFETVVTHELGHALGLGHSTDSTSVMYATLNTGTVNRTLTTADLNVADSDTTGACGLHAAVIPMPVASNVPLLDAPGQEAFFAMLANPAHAPAIASNALAPSVYDAVFANPISDLGTAKFAALSATPIFGAPATLETADDSFSLSPEDGAGTPLSPSAPPTDRLDLQFDFIPADGAIVVEC
jgi:hypothetical protein